MLATNKCSLYIQNHFEAFGGLGDTLDLEIKAKNPLFATIRNSKFRLQAIYLDSSSSVGHHQWF